MALVSVKSGFLFVQSGGSRLWVYSHSKGKRYEWVRPLWYVDNGHLLFDFAAGDNLHIYSLHILGLDLGFTRGELCTLLIRIQHTDS